MLINSSLLVLCVPVWSGIVLQLNSRVSIHIATIGISRGQALFSCASSIDAGFI